MRSVGRTIGFYISCLFFFSCIYFYAFTGELLFIVVYNGFRNVFVTW